MLLLKGTILLGKSIFDVLGIVTGFKITQSIILTHCIILLQAGMITAGIDNCTKPA